MIRLFALFIITLILQACSPSEPKLHIYTWGDFIKPEAVERFEKENHCRIVIDTFDSNEAMYAKLKAGASGYDILFPTGYILNIMEEQNMLHPMDMELIPNLRYLDKEYLQLLREPMFSNAVPYAITFSGIAYRKDKVQDPIPSWSIFGRTDLRGRMTILNDVREAFGAALKFLGYSINTVDPAQIDAAADQLILWKKNLAKFESEQYKNGIASAEYLVSQGYSGDVMQLIQEDTDVGFLLPDEGSIFSCDYIAIAKGASSIDLAHKFINYLFDPEIAALNMEHTFYRTPNTEAYKLLSPALRNNETLFPSKEFLERSEVIENLGPSIRLYNKAWDRVKG